MTFFCSWYSIINMCAYFDPYIFALTVDISLHQMLLAAIIHHIRSSGWVFNVCMWIGWVHSLALNFQCVHSSHVVHTSHSSSCSHSEHIKDYVTYGYMLFIFLLVSVTFEFSWNVGSGLLHRMVNFIFES